MHAKAVSAKILPGALPVIAKCWKPQFRNKELTELTMAWILYGIP